MKRLPLLFAILGYVFALCTVPVFAQFETASVLGAVHDSTGAVVAKATVTLINQETKSQVTAQTNEQGVYEFTDVKIGLYQVTATASGFDTGITRLR